MRIRILRGVVGEDRTDWFPGEEHDASDNLARYLVSINAAAWVGEAPAPVTPDEGFAAIAPPAPSKRRR